MAGFVVGAALQFALVVVITHGLPTARAGALLEAIALFMIVSNWGELGADTAMVRLVPMLRALGRHADVPGAIRAAAAPVLAAGLLAGLAGVACAGLVAHAFFSRAEQSQGATYVRVLSLMLPVASLATVLLAATRGFGSMAAYVGAQNIGIPLGRVLLVAAAIAAGLGPLGIGLAWSLPLVLALLAAGAVCRRLHRRDPPSTALPRRDSVLAGEVWRFAGPRALAAVFGVTITWFDVLLVGALASTREAAIYAAVSRLAVVGTYALQAMGMAVAPQFSAFVTLGQHDRLQHVYQLATWWMMAMAWPVYIVMLAFPAAVARLFGHDYGSGATALAILAAAGLFNLATGNITVLLLMAGNSRLNMLNAAGALALNVVLNLLLIPRFGMSGAAVAWAVSIVATNVAALIQVRRILGLQPFGHGYWTVAAGTVACFGLTCAALRLAGGDEPGVLLASVAIGSALYAVFLRRYAARIELGSLVGSVTQRARRVA
jgi:O-antigen/teichoic acid export membrane protein